VTQSPKPEKNPRLICALLDGCSLQWSVKVLNIFSVPMLMIWIRRSHHTLVFPPSLVYQFTSSFRALTPNPLIWPFASFFEPYSFVTRSSQLVTFTLSPLQTPGDLIAKPRGRDVSSVGWVLVKRRTAGVDRTSRRCRPRLPLHTFYAFAF